MSVAQEIQKRLAALQPERLELVDESAQHRGHTGWRPGGNTHWRLVIVSRAFADMPSLARHRLVYQALGELMNHPIHALVIKASSPEEESATLRDASSRPSTR